MIRAVLLASATVTSMSEGVLVTDRQGRARLVNPALRDLFGLPPDAEAASVLDLARQPLLGDLISTVLASRRSGSTELELLEPAARTLALFASPLGDGDGVVVVVRDVTEAGDEMQFAVPIRNRVRQHLHPLLEHGHRSGQHVLGAAEGERRRLDVRPVIDDGIVVDHLADQRDGHRGQGLRTRQADLALGRHDDRRQEDHRAQPGRRRLALLRAGSAVGDGGFHPALPALVRRGDARRGGCGGERTLKMSLVAGDYD